METELIFEGVPTSRLLDQIARARGWDPSTYAPRQEELDRMCQLATHALALPARRAGLLARPLLGVHESRGHERGAARARRGLGAMRENDGLRHLLRALRHRGDGPPARGLHAQSRPARRRPPAPRGAPYPPRLSATPWDDETAYPKGALVMHGGESWEAWIDVPAGEEPGESSEYWAPRRCPRLFEDYVVRAAAAELQTDDNARGRGLQAADRDLEKLYNNFTRQVNQPGRAMTRTFR